MKQLKIFLILICIYSCKSVSSVETSDEYALVNLTLHEYNEMSPFRIVQQPANNLHDNYFNGVADDSMYFEKTKFRLKQNHVKLWTKKVALGDKELEKKMEFTPSYSTIPMISLNLDTTGYKAYISISNALFSLDDQYGLISINIFGNMENTNIMDGYTLIFKRNGNGWELVAKFSAYVT